MPYDIDKIRQNLQKAVSGKRLDPDEFRVPKVTDKSLKYRFFILPPVMAGDKVKDGVAKTSMDNFFITHGEHWINNKPYPCPRVCSNEECELCSTGFDMMKKAKSENKIKAVTDAIRSQWMPSTSYYVNILFTHFKGNPEDLRGQVKYYKAPKTVLDIFISALTRDESGDEEDPQAYGVFFDEMKAFAFELEAVKDGSYNGYKSSKFLPNNGEPIPIIRLEDGEPDKAAIKKVLDNRIDIFSKLEKPDSSKIKRLASSILDGDDMDDSQSGGFDSDENAPTASTPKNEEKMATKTRKSISEEVGNFLISDDEEEKSSSSQDDEVPVKKQEAPKPKAVEKPKAKPAPPPVEDDDDLDVEDLLSQLGDDD